MNSKLKLALMLNRSRERGSTLPIILGLGLVMTLAGMTMIVRSSGNQITAAEQKATAQALAAAEGGITRTMSKLSDSRYAAYLLSSYDPEGILGSSINEWQNPPDVSFASACSVNTGGGDYDAIREGSLKDGIDYRVRAYAYDAANNKGTLILEGEKDSSQSQLEIDFDINVAVIPGTFPGVLSSESMSLGTGDIVSVDGDGDGTADPSAGSVICESCTASASACSDGTLTENELEDAIGASSTVQANVSGQIMISQPADVPDVPKITDADVVAVGVTKIDREANGTADHLEIKSSGGGSPGTDETLAIGTYTLPRASEADVTRTDPYYYQVKSMDIKGTLNIVTDDPTYNTAPVYIFVTGTGSVITGNGSVTHDGDAGNFRIYGLPDDGDSVADQSISLSGGSTAVNLFIYAPDADVTFSGSGPVSPDFIGAVWAKSYTANGTGVEVGVPDNIEALLGGEFIGAGLMDVSPTASTSWKRNAAN